MPFRHTANNFDFIRIAAALMVLCSHQYALLFQPEPRPLGLFTLGTLGVLIFFSTSGYLVAQSWQRDPHWWRFLLRRFLRIWPGLCVVTLVTMFCVGPAFTDLPLADYFRSSATWAYLKYLWLGGSPYLPGVFEGNRWPVVNGSLWTIPIEVKWYAVLLAAGVLGLLRPRFRYVLLAAAVLYACYIYFVWDVQHNPQSAFPLPGFGCEYGTFFCYGVLLHFMRNVWAKRVTVAVLALALLACLLVARNYQFAAVYACLPFLVIWFGNKSTLPLRHTGRFGDFSYGIYIYAFPVQQALVSVLGFGHSYMLMLPVSLACTMVCAVFSWYVVERPALALKRYLRNEGESGERPAQAAALDTVS
jgi:peptidoglycan/LPS O-acetylase OafA/YrhL